MEAFFCFLAADCLPDIGLVGVGGKGCCEGAKEGGGGRGGVGTAVNNHEMPKEEERRRHANEGGCVEEELRSDARSGAL